MSAPIFTAVSGVFAATAGAKTALNVLAGANQNIALLEWGVAFDGVTASAVPATVDLCQSTQGAAGTPGSTPSAVQTTGRTLAFQGSLGVAYSAEPTALTVIDSLYVPQFMGVFRVAIPLGYEPETDFSGGTIRALAIRVNVTANVNVKAFAKFTLCG